MKGHESNRSTESGVIRPARNILPELLNIHATLIADFRKKSGSARFQGMDSYQFAPQGRAQIASPHGSVGLAVEVNIELFPLPAVNSASLP